MSTINDGGPAFPSHGTMGEVTHEGMTLRDYFAATRNLEDDAMDFVYDLKEAIVGRPCPDWRTEPYKCALWNAEFRAKWNYMQADAMLAARNAK